MSLTSVKEFKENYSTSYGAVPKFEWIDDETEEALQNRRTGWDQIAYKFKKDPLIPLGTFATIGALSYGLRAFKKGDSMLQQYMMRARVGFQAFTIAVFCFSSAGIVHYMNNDKVDNESMKTKQEVQDEKSKAVAVIKTK